MPAAVFVRFLERKLTEHGIGKVDPDDDVLQHHARRVLTTRVLTNQALDAIRAKAEDDAGSIALPSDLRQQVVAAHERQSDIAWDFAVAYLARKMLSEDGAA
jgi:hypothetical protein